MNKNESKYFNTAAKMDIAFLNLIQKKDYAFITVKEICETAKVNRSTFYLHYESVSDLLAESVEYMNNRFLNHMNRNASEFTSKLNSLPPKDLIFITPEYLTPYLEYIKQNRRLFLAVIKNSSVLRLDEIYNKMFKAVFTPILTRYSVEKSKHRYILAYYIEGIMAVINEWIKSDCKHPEKFVVQIICDCVLPNGIS